MISGTTRNRNSFGVIVEMNGIKAKFHSEENACFLNPCKRNIPILKRIIVSSPKIFNPAVLITYFKIAENNYGQITGNI